jgi:1,4-alpha-glucan branching enzyme
LSYRELAPLLADYALGLGFTHVEFMPSPSIPFYGSWGYQTTGYFAPTARYGEPRDLMALVDHLHQRGLGVIVDWVPSHFPSDAHGLAYFEGTHLYEHADPRQGYHPEWHSCIFNYGRHEVAHSCCRAPCSGSIAIMSMRCASTRGLDAVSRLCAQGRRVGAQRARRAREPRGRDVAAQAQRSRLPGSSGRADVRRGIDRLAAGIAPTWLGGLGFGLKWNMGWMHDTLKYFGRDPIYRGFHHGQITFSLWYAFNENFVLPLSHDEVVYGKGSLIGKMPGDDWQRFANLRCLLGYMWGHPGKKLLFMGGEFGQWREWNHDQSLDWHLTQFPDARRAAVVGARPESHARGLACHVRAGFRCGRLRVDRLLRRANSVVAFCGARAHRASRCSWCAASRRSPAMGIAGRARAGPLARGPQQRCRVLWRQRHGQLRRSGRRGRSQRTGTTARFALTLPPLAVLFLEPA